MNAMSALETSGEKMSEKDPKVTRIPMNKNRKGTQAKWTSKNREEQVAVEISDGLRCARCTKEFTFEKDEKIVIPRPKYSNITYHENCWKAEKGEPKGEK